MSKNEVSKYSLVAWFNFTEEIPNTDENTIEFKERIGFEIIPFDSRKEALSFKDKIWSKGIQLEDEIGTDWCRVSRVRILNNELARAQHQNSVVEKEEVKNE